MKTYDNPEHFIALKKLLMIPEGRIHDLTGFFRQPEMFLLSDRDFESLMLEDQGIHIIYNNEKFELFVHECKRRNLSGDAFCRILSSKEPAPGESLIESIHGWKHIESLLEVVEDYKLSAKQIFNLFTVCKTGSYRVCDLYCLDHLIRIVKLSDLNKTEIKDFLIKSKFETSEGPLSHRLIFFDVLSEFLSRLEPKMDPSEIKEIVLAKSLHHSNVFHQIFIKKRKPDESAGKLVCDYRLSKEEVLSLLFTPNSPPNSSESKSAIQVILNEKEIFSSFPDFFTTAKMSPDTVLAIMDRMKEIKPLPVSDIDPAQIGLVYDLSHLASNLLGHADPNDTVKCIENVQRILDEDKSINLSWRKLFQMMKRVHQKQSGSFVQGNLSRSPSSIPPHQALPPRRLQLAEVVKGGV
jgi:hypothetical protein